MPKERSFQNYFMSIAKPLNYYRTSLTSGSGYPDITAFHGERHSLIELKDIVLGKRGDKKLAGVFQPSQIPWYLNYFACGGCRLFVAFRITNADATNKRYGLWKLTKDDVLAIDEYYYSKLLEIDSYREYKTLKELIEDIEKWGGEK